MPSTYQNVQNPTDRETAKVQATTLLCAAMGIYGNLGQRREEQQTALTEQVHKVLQDAGLYGNLAELQKISETLRTWWKSAAEHGARHGGTQGGNACTTAQAAFAAHKAVDAALKLPSLPITSGKHLPE